MFSYTKHANSNHPGSDASIQLGAIGPFDISVRCLTKSGIKFQKSKHIGSSRKATQQDVYDAICGVEHIVVADIRSFPELVFIPLDSKWLLQLAHSGRLTAAGMSESKFTKWLSESFALSTKSFDIALALSSSNELSSTK